jgi:membrane protein YdbS with pleckstrin-like domain
MSYSSARALALQLLRSPAGPPDTPAGSHGSVQVFRASPRYLSYRLLGYWILFGLSWLAWGILCIAALVDGEAAVVVVALLAALPLAVALSVAYFTTRIDYDQRYYVVTDRSVRVRSGALIVKELTVSYANVQNLRVDQGPLQKLFGLHDLRIDTAGGGATRGKDGEATGHALELAGLEDAHAIRDQILGYVRHFGRGAGLGDPEALHQRGSSGLSPRALAALREVHTSAAALRRTCEARV